MISPIPNFQTFNSKNMFLKGVYASVENAIKVLVSENWHCVIGLALLVLRSVFWRG